MPLFSFEEHKPVVRETAWIAPTASLIGEVTNEEGASVWFGTIIRADFGPIVIRAGANIEDGSIVHGGPMGTARSLVAAGSTVAPNTEIPDDVLALGSPAKVTGPLSDNARLWVGRNPRHTATWRAGTR